MNVWMVRQELRDRLGLVRGEVVGGQVSLLACGLGDNKKNLVMPAFNHLSRTVPSSDTSI